MIRGWFAERDENYNDFIKALLSDDIRAMNYYMNKVAPVRAGICPVYACLPFI